MATESRHRKSQWRLRATETFYRIAASGILPARMFLQDLPEDESLPGRTGPLKIEIVTHCWKYAHLLAYQLSSVVAHPPANGEVTMTVCYSEEDAPTVALLDSYSALEVRGVRWNWLPFTPEELYRRAIGRNRAARQSQADWVWYTDCDVLFLDGCLNGLIEALQGRRDRLVYPSAERTTPLLLEGDPLLARSGQPLLASLDTSRFTPETIHAAKGAWQITHGDFARIAGYCDLPFYQTPRDHWIKCYEDRTYRWLIRSEGTPIDVPSIYRIRHAEKGRYSHNSTLVATARRNIRRLGSWMSELRKGSGAGRHPDE